ncbi:sensor histidine kinase [Soonwooa purpurea]
MFSIHRFLLIFIICCCSSIFGQQKSRDTFLIKGANWENMTQYVRFYKDSTRQLNLQKIIDLEQTQHFQKRGEYRVFNSQYTKASYWFVLPIKNVNSKELQVVWSFYNNNFKITFYDITLADQPKFLGQVSPQQRAEERLFHSRALVLPFSLQAGEYKKILAKVELINANQIYFLSDVTTVEDMMFWELNYGIIVGQFLGYFAFMFLFNIFLFFLLKKEIHLWHGLYVFSIILFSLNENIVDVLLLPNWFYHFYIQFPKMLWLLISLILNIKVFQMFTDQKTKFPRLYKVLHFTKNIAIFLAVSSAVFSLLFNVQTPIVSEVVIALDVILVIGTILLFFSIIYASIKKDKDSLYFFVATIFILIAFINYLMDLLLQMQVFYFQPGNILVGLMVEVSLLTAFFLTKIVKKSRESRKQLQLKNIENQNLSFQMLNLQEEERKEIAQEIHDGVGSHLSGLKLYLQNIFQSKNPIDENIKAEVLHEMKIIYDDLRSISHQLMPAYIEESNLSELLKNKFEQYRRQFPHIKFNDVQSLGDVNLQESDRLHIYRIVTALLDNAIKHSECTEIDFQIYCEDNNIEILLEDNGIGFDPEAQFSGIGLKSVKSRIQFLKANINIESNKNGSTFIILIPIN